jgi:integrase/recombinase XerD
MNKELVENFLAWLTIGHTKETANSYKWGLKIFYEWVDGNEKEILRLELQDFVDYALYLAEVRKVALSTQFCYLITLRSFWGWLVRQNRVVNYDIPFPRKDEIKHYASATMDEMEKIINYFGEFWPDEIRNKTIVSFLCDTGVRIGEFLSIDAGDLNLENMKCVVKTSKRVNHQREIYWTERTNNLLKKWLTIRNEYLKTKKNCEALWIAMDTRQGGGRLEKSTIQKMFRRVRNEVGIEKKITPHSFRHGFGKRAVENNVHPRYIQKFLGHAKLETTMFYMGVEDVELEKVYQNKMVMA